MTSELLGSKTFPIYNAGSFHLNASVAIFVVPVIFSINDVITEVLGAERARSLVRSGLAIIFLLVLFSVLATSLPASTRFLPTEPAYDKIFTTSTRIAIASLTAFALSDFMDVAIFARLRKQMGKRSLWLRNNLSNFISQFFDTTTFLVLAFYALDQSLGSNASFLWSLILPYWLLKCGMSIIETPFVYLGVSWLNNDVPKA